MAYSAKKMKLLCYDSILNIFTHMQETYLVGIITCIELRPKFVDTMIGHFLGFLRLGLDKKIIHFRKEECII